jgi:hypothetical protein
MLENRRDIYRTSEIKELTLKYKLPADTKDNNKKGQLKLVACSHLFIKDPAIHPSGKKPVRVLIGRHQPTWLCQGPCG